jgi:pimeloyl-ACP methyl ester carboxylesterase
MRVWSLPTWDKRLLHGQSGKAQRSGSLRAGLIGLLALSCLAASCAQGGEKVNDSSNATPTAARTATVDAAANVRPVATPQSTGTPGNTNVKPPTQQITVGDISVAYRRYGQGAPLLFITGYASTMDSWNPDLIAALAQSYSVITFDNRGVGLTTAGVREFSIEQFAEDTAGLMDALGVPRAGVFAWSMGTTIAQELALRHPDRVERLILYAAQAGGAQAIEPSQEVVDILTDTSGTPEEQGARLLSLLVSPQWLGRNWEYIGKIFSGPQEPMSAENIGKQAAAIATWPGAHDRLAKLAAPTLLMTGADDVIAPPANSVQMAGQIPQAWLVQLRGGGHGIQYQYPEQMAQVMSVFLSMP